MKKLIFLFIIGILSQGSFQERKEALMLDDTCKVHRLFCSILLLQPKAEMYAMEMSDYIYKYSKIYKVDPFIAVAIAMQESSLIRGTLGNPQQGIEKVEVCHKSILRIPNDNVDPAHVCETRYKIKTFYDDASIYQFHIDTILAFDIDVERLMFDLEYATKQLIKLIKHKQKVCQNLNDKAWSCYHSSTPKNRKKYEKQVLRHYNKIKEFKDL